MYPLLTHDREIASGPTGLAADAASVCSTVRLGIVCPMANESGTAEAFVKAVLSHCGEFLGARFFAVVDNVSSDNTLDILRRLAVDAPSLHVIWAPENT